MKRLHKILVGTVGALSLIGAAAVMAAPGDGMGRCGDGMGMGPGMGMMHEGPMRGGDIGLLAQKRLDRLKTELKITAEQEPAWQAFAAKATEQAKAMQATHQQHLQQMDKQAAAGVVNAPERMAQHLGEMKQHLATMEAMQVTLKDLYAALTPEQRATADRHFARMQHMRMGRRMHR